MATTGILRSRRGAAERHALASVEREIRAADHSACRQYLRDFRDAYRSYEKVLTPAEVDAAIAGSGVVLVGDYHALPASQRYLASRIRSAQRQARPLVVGVETIFSRDQHILDEWFRGEIDEAELRQRIRFDLDWGYDWAPFFDLLSASRDHAAGLYGLDCMPREDLRKIGARDRHAADKVAEIRGRHPDALIVVLFGESHLAPKHMPALVRERLPKERVLTVLQNVDSLYWHAAGEDRDHIDAVRVSDDVICVFNSTPLEKYENYRLYLNRWGQDGSGVPDLAPTVYNLVDGLVRLLEINRYSPHNSSQPRLLVDLMPEVYSGSSDALLRRLLSRRGFTPGQRRATMHRIKERGSAYLAPLNALCVQKFQMMTAAEDAARFLHHACRGLPYRNRRTLPATAPYNAFYVATLEHALACFGSRLLYPARAPFRDVDLLELYELTREDLEQQTSLRYARAVEAIDFLVMHRESDRTGRKADAVAEWLNQNFAGNNRTHEYVTCQLGCLLGNDLYDAYLDGHLRPSALRKLFLTHIEEPGLAAETYFGLNRQLR